MGEYRHDRGYNRTTFADIDYKRMKVRFRRIGRHVRKSDPNRKLINYLRLLFFVIIISAALIIGYFS